jgi:hypothetical protein
MMLKTDGTWGARLLGGEGMRSEGGRIQVNNAGVLEEAVGGIVSEVMRRTLVAIIVGI